MSGLDSGDGSDESGGSRGEERVPSNVVLKMSERVGGDEEEEGEDDEDDGDEDVEEALELELLLGSLILTERGDCLVGMPKSNDATLSSMYN